MYIMYIVFIALLAVAGFICVIMGLSGDVKCAALGLIFLLMIPVVALVPHARPDDCIYVHEIIQTDTYNNIKYDKVIRVEYDIRKGPWWSWESLETTQNLKIITEDK